MKRFSKAEKRSAIRMSEEQGVKAAAEILGIHAVTLRRWRRIAGIKPAQRGSYTLTQKLEAVALVQRTSLAKAAKELGIPAVTIFNWKAKGADRIAAEGGEDGSEWLGRGTRGVPAGEQRHWRTFLTATKKLPVIEGSKSTLPAVSPGPSVLGDVGPVLSKLVDDLTNAAIEVEGIMPQVHEMVALEASITNVLTGAQKLLSQKDDELKRAKSQIASVTRQLAQKSGAMVTHSEK